MQEEVKFPQPTAPQLSKTPLETLQDSEIFRPTFLGQHGCKVGLPVGFCIGFLSNNLYNKRPPYASGWGYFVVAPLAYFLGTYLDNVIAEQRSRKIFLLRHYVEKHPEDFPPYERVKIGDLFLPWHPVR